MTISDVVVGNLTTLYLVVIAAMKAYGLATGRSFSSGCVLILSTLVVAAILIATLTYDVWRKATDALMTRDHGHEMCRGGICWHGVAVKSPASQIQETMVPAKRKFDEGQSSGQEEQITKPPMTSLRRDRPLCATCHKNHDGICLRGTYQCYRCKKSGHIAKNCPNSVRSSVAISQEKEATLDIPKTKDTGTQTD